MADKMVLIQSTPDVVFIRDSSGLDVDFMSFEEFEKYTGIVLVSGDYTNYEPDRDIYLENGVAGDPANVASYESMISNVQVYKDRKNDPYYGATLEEAKISKKEEIDGLNYDYSSANILYDGQNYYADRANIDPTYAVASNKVIENDTAWTVRWTTADRDGNGVSIKVIHNAESFMAFAETLYVRNEDYFQSAADHKDNVVVLTTVDDVKNYDATTGW